MDTEFEARFLDIDTDAFRHTLRAQGGLCVMPRTLMRRFVFTNKDIAERGGWLRLRDEGRRVTMTYKQTTSDVSAIDTTLEAEIQVDDFLAAKALLEAMGFEALRYQENYREEWKLGEVTLDVDTWPGLSTYVEVEGPSEAVVRETAEKLGFDFAYAGYGSVDEVYLAVLNRDILKEETLTFAATPGPGQGDRSTDR
ncbi:class IV adenylate cyclase [Actinoplanes sp. LDG1-06]|uniref:Class IV adenylate cyclase n=1 Tax=Paractinoplanes ovalisporus TaxID=2810368 RepID=A0ABS2AG83_9ACTN|nr:class IV adenylate cyclase [Actinoplanes ovalisporus]MBM2618259.1 class IV adenylate cyclase [Actinoplanes ovalisporus]